MGVYDDGRITGRARISGIVEHFGECTVCGWSSYAKNAVANAARHTDASGHVTQCHQIMHTTYGPPGSTRDQLRMRQPGEDAE